LIAAVSLQDAGAAKTEAEKSQEGFFGWQTALWASIPIVLAVILAMTRRRKEPPLPHVGDADFDDVVLASPKPVLVHFYRTWSIGDRVMINQARRIAERNGDALNVVWLDVDQSPGVVGRFSHVETPAFLFFADGKCLFHCEGVVDEADVHREMWEAHSRHARRLASREVDAGSPSA
jgi:thioredoxin-like negative regulator of GroEL